VTAVLDALKKRGTFKDYEKAQNAYVEAKKAVELAEAGLALLNGTGARPKKVLHEESPGEGQRILQRSPCKDPRN
jgi:hypothetical protein